MARFDTAAARDQWATDRLTSMLKSGIKSASEAVLSHRHVGNMGTAHAWSSLELQLELLHDLVASGLFDRIKDGGPEWDAIKAWREARDAEKTDLTPPAVADMRAIFGEPVEGRDYNVMPGGES